MLSNKLIKETINGELEDDFQLFQFKAQANDKDSILKYRKKFRSGFQSCIFTISSFPVAQNSNKTNSLEKEETTVQEFWIEMSIGVRIDTVERIANQFTLILEDYYDETHTILTSYGRMTDDRYFRFKVQDEAQLKLACQKMSTFLQSTGFQFLNNHSSVYSLDKLINNYPEKPSKFIYNQSYRCIKGIILASLAQNPHFNTLTKAYHFILQKQSLADRITPKYSKLVAHLKVYSVN